MHYQADRFKGVIKAVSHTYHHGDEEQMHSHTTAQLLHSISGIIKVHADGKIWILAPGKGLWIPKGVFHKFTTIGTVEVRALFIDPYARADLPNTTMVFDVSPLLKELIISALDFEYPYEQFSREEHVVELILYELRTLSIGSFYVPMPNIESSIYSVCQMIIGRISHPWTTQDIANVMQLSVRQVSRIFKDTLGTSFGEWLRNYRISEAMILIAQGMSILEASLDVGYDSQTAFGKVFKRRVGITPVHYAAQFRKLTASSRQSD